MTRKSPNILIIQTGTPPEDLRNLYGDLPHWFCRATDQQLDAVEVVRVYEGESMPPPDSKRVAIITGSSFMVTDRHPWSEAAAHWIRHAMAIEMPLFGVCYGHQLMAQALGGRVDYHPKGREIGTHTIRLLASAEDDPLLGHWPSQFPAHLTHLQTIVDLPRGAYSLAVSDHDPHQVVRYGRNAISTQFHPEFTPQITAAVIEHYAEAMQKDGIDSEPLRTSVREAPEATMLMRRFVTTMLESVAGS
jgi:GMP synthase (glutamine-hydrolysing)